jgi:hypothetical protein
VLGNARRIVANRTWLQLQMSVITLRNECHPRLI